jgi:hypothetical protein
MWETMHLCLAIAMVTVAQFFQKVDSRGFANGRFNYGAKLCGSQQLSLILL